jgi:hypothetical protein
VIDPFTVLAEDEDLPRWDVPEALAALYGGAIGLDEPCVVANFVESLDGVVAVPRLPRSHAVIGDESEADRFVLALVRACADAVVVGSGTLLASPKGTWRIDRAYPPAAAALAELRSRRGRSEQPLVVVVCATAAVRWCSRKPARRCSARSWPRASSTSFSSPSLPSSPDAPLPRGSASSRASSSSRRRGWPADFARCGRTARTSSSATGFASCGG